MIASSVNAFVGREHEMSLLRRTMRTNRLTSVVGPGGIGKTRIVRELANRSTQDMKIVEVAAPVAGNTLPDFVMAALGVREKPGETALSALVAQLERQRFVLVLDNCEHIVDECSAFVAGLLRRCAKLHMIVTSREPLLVPGEVVVRLGPLPADVAARLFTDRAGVGADLTDDDRVAISRICDNVEGLPLAVELAARRARATSVREVADGLSDLLHHDLRATIEWSYRLLSHTERAVVRGVSLLVGGFSLDAATAICPVPPDEVLPTLLRLVAKSLVERTGAPDGSIRFRMPESIRVFARDRLHGRGEEPATWTRTLTWLIRLTPPLLEEVFLPGSYTRALEAERDNLLAALQSLAATGERPDDRVLLAAALARGWHLGGRVTTAMRMLRRLLAELPDTPHRAVLLQPISAGHLKLGDIAEAVRTAVEAVVSAGGQQALEVRMLNQLGCVLIVAERYATAEAVFRHALRLADGLAPMAAAQLRNNHAWMSVCAGDPERAAELLEPALAVYREHVADGELGHVLHTAATVDIALGRYTAARARLLEILRVAPHSVRSLPQLTEGLGIVAEAHGDPVRALVLFAAGAAGRARIRRAVGNGWRSRVLAAESAATAQLSRKAVLAARRRGMRMSEQELRAYLVEPDTDDMPLTARELQVMRCLADGDGNQQIARQLGMALRTVTSHVERVKEKLGLYDRSSLQQWFLVQRG